ncbi:MAG: hypothetical protein HOV71_19065 [Hamadaea sp.]|nr:hypothetical protein [Hamadaea sp.]
MAHTKSSQSRTPFAAPLPTCVGEISTERQLQTDAPAKVVPGTDGLEYPRHVSLASSLIPAEIDMSSRRARSSRVGAALAAITILAMPGTASGAAPAYTLEERAQSIMQPAVVYTELVIQGEVHEKSSNKPLTDHPITVRIECSGVIVDTSGAMISTRPCVAATLARAARLAFTAVADELVETKKITAAQRDARIDALARTADFTGAGGAGVPQRSLLLQTGDATSGTTDSPAISLTAPDAAEDEIGLVFVATGRSDLPVAELSPDSKLDVGAAATAMGYQPTAGKARSIGVMPVNITKLDNTVNPVQHLLTPRVKPDMRGGALIDQSGKLIGFAMLTNAAYDSKDVLYLMSQAGVENRLSETDRLYREALDDYYAGRYDEAMTKFAKVSSAQKNPFADQLRQRAASRKAIEGGETPITADIPFWAIIAGSVAGGLIIGFLIAFLFRRRSRANRLYTEPLIPVSTNPFSPTSGGAAYPVSGGSFAGFPPGYGPGSEPTSGAGQYPPGPYPAVGPGQQPTGYPTLDPTQPPRPAPQPTVLEIPQAAAPGIPIPLPPHQRPPMMPPAPPQTQAPNLPPVPQAAPPQAAPPHAAPPHAAPPHAAPPHAAPPQAAPQINTPAPQGPPAQPPVHPPTQPPAPGSPDFAWPEDDEHRPGDKTDNPWAPPPPHAGS